MTPSTKNAACRTARDYVSILRHTASKLTKTWKRDGTIEPYTDPKYFLIKEIPVDGIADLSKLLSELEGDPQACIIRGRYKGHEHSLQAEPDDTKENRVLRRKSVYDDTAHHWVLVDIDNFVLPEKNPLIDPVGAINEFTLSCLPPCFHGTSYHWQLSSSAGHPSKPVNALKAHVWFWLMTPYTSAQLRAWALATDFKGDKALLDTIQIHYTATPVFEDALVDYRD